MRLLPFTIILLLNLGNITDQKSYAQTNLWPAVKKEMKPWTRWWWMGNAVDEANISALLKDYQQIGIGGVEIAPIYGAKGYESQYIDYLSPDWMDRLRFTTKTAKDLGMGVDLTNGTGWPFGGRQVDEEHAATKLIVQKYQLNAGASLAEKIKSTDQKQPKAELLSLTAYDDKGSIQLLTDSVGEDGTLKWQPSAGNWDLYAAFMGKTQQKVKRAAPGGEGLTLDHYSSDALAQYLQPFDKAFGSQSPGVRAFYNDSYEVYGADWTRAFFDAFQQKRGYDLRLYIREFSSNDTSSDEVARIKSDYRETLAELLLENFTKPWTTWTRKYQGMTKNQAHGSPGNLIDLYAAVDIPEGETFGSSYFPIPGLRRDSSDVRNVDPDPIMLKFASSAANITGKNLVSLETFTWLTEHFKTSWAQCKPEIEQAFLAGINHVFYHGTTYSPSSAKWPGWLFYASVNFVPANSLWQHLDGLNHYITRVQSVLQSGKSDNELLVYWPVYDIWHDAKGRDKPLKVHDIDEWLQPTPFYNELLTLQQEGYSFDFISDNLLMGLTFKEGELYAGDVKLSQKALLIPETDKMPVETLEKLVQLADEGAAIVFQTLPKDVEGFYNKEKRSEQFKASLTKLKNKSGGSVNTKHRVRIQPAILTALNELELKGEVMVKDSLQFIRRKDGEDVYYYIVNHSGKKVDQYISLQTRANQYYIMDPLSNRVGKADLQTDDTLNKVRIQLASGESCIIKCSNALGDQIQNWSYINEKAAPINLMGKWELTYKDGGPAKPKNRQMEELKLWTAFGDEDANHFSGTAVYKLTFNIPKLDASDYLLQLDTLCESAKITLNGKEAGQIWSLPYTLRIGELLREGRNTIEIEVANLMANRIRYMDRKNESWRDYHEINFVNIDYSDFDASNWEVMPSGISGGVSLIPLE